MIEVGSRRGLLLAGEAVRARAGAAGLVRIAKGVSSQRREFLARSAVAASVRGLQFERLAAGCCVGRVSGDVERAGAGLTEHPAGPGVGS